MNPNQYIRLMENYKDNLKENLIIKYSTDTD